MTHICPFLCSPGLPAHDVLQGPRGQAGRVELLRGQGPPLHPPQDQRRKTPLDGQQAHQGTQSFKHSHR